MTVSLPVWIQNDIYCARLIFKDRNKPEALRQLEATINLYENQISSGNLNEDCLLNLGFIYGQCCEAGFHMWLELKSVFIEEASDRFPKLLTLGRQNFPDNIEFPFWEKYMAFWLNGEDFTCEECVSLLMRNRENLVPLFFLNTFPSMIDGYSNHLRELINSCKLNPTVKNSYILSVLGVI